MSLDRRDFIKGVGAAAGTSAVMYGGNTVVPQSRQIDGSAKAILPAVAAGAVLGTSVMSVAGLSALTAEAGADLYQESQDFYNQFFGGSEREPDADVSSEANSVVRENAHKEAISAAAYLQSTTNDFSNDLNTLEGEYEQRVTRDIVGNTDQYSSKTELVSYTESLASKYLWRNLKNPLNTWNFGSVDIRGIQRKLESAGFGGDMVVISETEANANNQDFTGDYITQTSDISITSLVEPSNAIYDLGGFTVTHTGDYEALNADNVTVNGGGGLIESSGDAVISSNSGNSTVILSNVTLKANTASTDHLEDVEYYIGENVTFIDENGNELDTPRTASDSYTAVELDSKPSQTLTGDSVTFDPSDISDTNLQATANFTRNEVDRSLTAVEVPTQTSYENANEAPLTLAMPYISSSGTPLNQTNKTLVVNTPTSGNESVVEPLDYNEVYSLLTERDSLANNIYNSTSTLAEGLWTDNFSGYDDTQTAVEESNINKDIAQYTPPNFDPSSPRQVNSIYAGNYDTVKQTYATTQTYKTADGQEITGVLWSTDLSAVAGGKSLIQVGDILDPTQAQSTFIVRDEDGARFDLESQFEVLGFQRNAEQISEVEYRGFDYESTQLGDLGQRIEEKNSTVEEIVNTSGGGAGFFNDPINVILAALGIGGAAYLANDQNGGNSGNNTRRRR